MKIIWNNKNIINSAKESNSGQIALPKPSGNWISEENISFFEEDEQTDEIGIVHIPQKSPLPSIQEINLHQQQENLEITQPIEETENSQIDPEPEAVELPSNLIPITQLKQLFESAANNGRFQEHQSELRQIAVFCLSVVTLSLLPYTTPALADYRPWTQEEAPPLISLWTSQKKMTENESGALVSVDVPTEELLVNIIEEPLLEHAEEEEALEVTNCK